MNPTVYDLRWEKVQDEIRKKLFSGVLVKDVIAEYGFNQKTIIRRAKLQWGFKARRGHAPYDGPCLDCGDGNLCRKTKRCRKCLNRRVLLARGGGNGPATGPRNPNWKGGKSRNDLRLVPAYHVWRKAVFARDNYTCRACGLTGVFIVADHIIPFAFLRDNAPELLYLVDNGQTLCEPCHRKTITYGERAKRFRGVLARWYINKHRAVSISYIQDHQGQVEQSA